MMSAWYMVMAVLVVTVTCTSAVVFPPPAANEADVSYWYNLMRQELYEAMERPKNTKKAKNILFFLGDGMGVTVSTAGRILKGQKHGVSGEEGFLVWDRFPNVGLLKTYNLDKQVSDSAAAGTAYLTGVKGNFETIGVTGNVKLMDCSASLLPENRLDSIVKWAQDAGKATGIVTTTQVTHASPAALYAKTAFREWQCDTKMIAANATHCKDIARQLVEDEPGRNLNVIMGGGRQEMGAPLLPAKPRCPRSDGRNLVEEWKQDKEDRDATYAYVTNTRQLRDVDFKSTNYLMGLFGERHTPHQVDRDDSLDGTPSLKEMVLSAIAVLQNSPEGFFLMVESGAIDLALHYSQPRRGLEELVHFDETVEAALKTIDLDDTLVIVTADHSHAMTLTGYPPRGNDIFGLVHDNVYVTDGLPYTTLMFTAGQGYNYTWDGQKVVRPNLTGVDTGHKDYVSLAAIPTETGEEAHGGEDVAAFAIGPMSHLFHRTHEQTYVAHVMALSACIGPYATNCVQSPEIDPLESNTINVNDPEETTVDNLDSNPEESTTDSHVHVKDLERRALHFKTSATHS